MMARALPGPHPPWDALWWKPTIHLAVFVHRVDDLAPGLYMLVRHAGHQERLVEATHNKFCFSSTLTLQVEGVFFDVSRYSVT